MAGHSKFKNIMHRKGAQDAKRAKLFTRILREVTVAAKEGGADAENNSRLRVATLAARDANIPKDKVQNAINKATNAAEIENFEEIRYEGYALGNIALIVEALTDNRNRTASEVRAAFTKHCGQLGETGSVNFMFKRVGIICYSENTAHKDTMFEAAAEAGGDDCTSSEGKHEIECSPENFPDVRTKLETKFGYPEYAEIIWKPKTQQLLSIEEGEKLLKLLNALEECEDVQNVTGNYEFPPELLQKLKND